MRYLFLLVLAAMIHTGVFAQRITLVMHQEKLQNIFKEIRKQSNYDFLYNEELMKDLQPISITLKNASVKQVLDSLFSNLPFQYSIQNQIVMVSAIDSPLKTQTTSYAIRGIIQDQKGIPIPGASVFISNTRIGVVTDRNGRFVIDQLSSGSYSVVVQMLGYLPASRMAIIIDRSAEMVVVLQEALNLLKEVVVKPDLYRPFRLKVFKDAFIGTSLNARYCEILNPDVLRFDYDTAHHILRATADDLIIIENRALGYRIKYLLRYFEKDENMHYVHFHGYPYFEEIEEVERKRRRYLKKRQEAYLGSPEHFFCSLYKNSVKESGFLINKLVKTPNDKKLPDSVIDARIKDIDEHVEIIPRQKKRKAAIRELMEMKEEPDTLEVLVRRPVIIDSLVKEPHPPLKTISFDNALYIIFTGERETEDFARYPEYKIKRPDDLRDYQISLVYQMTRSVSFYENGSIYDPNSLLYEGVWAYKKVADMLPLDYALPERKKRKKEPNIK